VEAKQSEATNLDGRRRRRRRRRPDFVKRQSTVLHSFCESDSPASRALGESENQGYPTSVALVPVPDSQFLGVKVSNCQVSIVIQQRA